MSATSGIWENKASWNIVNNILIVGADGSYTIDISEPDILGANTNKDNVTKVIFNGNFVFTDTNSVGLAEMFKDYKALTAIEFNGLFDTSKVTKFNNLFKGCTNLKSIDLAKFNTSSASDLTGMFDGCTQLTSIKTNGVNMLNYIGNN